MRNRHRRLNRQMSRPLRTVTLWGGKPLMQATDNEGPTLTEPKEEPERQRVILEEVAHESPDANPEEAVEVPALDEPPVVEATGGVIMAGVTEEPKCPGVTIPRTIDENTVATPAPMTALPLLLEEYQGMPELENAKPRGQPME